MRIAFLGPLSVTDDAGCPRSVGGARLRTLLIRLALEPGRSVGADALIDAVWGDQPPAAALNALQALVSRLRKALPDGVLEATATGYRVIAETDAAEFEALAQHGAPAEALRLWRGEPLVDVADADFATPVRARLADLHATATENAFAQAGAGVDISALESFAAAHPLRERPHAQLIAALAAAGRQADAVAVYDGLRRRLADQLGLDPSPELAETYAAMLRGDRTVGNVRVALTSFVGREPEIDAIVARVRGERLVTLVGPGGAGKTRLSTEVGRRLSRDARGHADGASRPGGIGGPAPGATDSFADGVWMVELAPVRNHDDVPRAVADTLRLRDPIRLRELGLATDARDITERVIDALHDRELLLILDNCEHLIEAAARFADEVVGRCPRVRVLATSREPLAITGESLCPVGPLDTPPLDASAAQALAHASVRLLRDRAGAVKAGFAVTDANVGAVVEICRRLDGMPLAIELACARLRTLPVETIAARLDDRFRLLTGGSRVAMPRHQTLLAVVEWSWSLLSDAEREVAANLSVFRNGASGEMLTEIFGAALDVDDALAGLVDKSFVTLDGDGRYQMLETLRAYAGDRLAESGRADTVRRVVAAYLADRVAAAEAAMRGPEQSRSLAWTTVERDNLNAAMRWAIDAGEAEIAMRIAGSMGWFWLLTDSHTEAAGWLAEVVLLPGDVNPEVRALALGHYGISIMVVRTEPVVEEPLEQAKRLGSRHPVVFLCVMLASMFGDDIEKVRAELPALLNHEDPWVRAIGRSMDGLSEIYRGHPKAAEEKLIESLVEFRIIGDQWAIATMTSAVGEIRAMQGDWVGAEAMLTEAVELASTLGVTDTETQAFISLGLLHARSGDLDAARAALQRSEAAIRRGGGGGKSTRAVLDCAWAEVTRYEGRMELARERYRDVIDVMSRDAAMPHELMAVARSGLAFAEMALGDVAEAERLAGQIRDVAHGMPDRMTLAEAAVVFAAVSVMRGDPTDAARLIGISDVLRGLPDMGKPDARRLIGQIQAAIGDDAYATAYHQGFDLKPEQASAALADGARHTPPG